jgi:hypothetical protein
VTGTLYCSLQELKQSLAITDATSDVDLERALDAASRAVEGFTGREFFLRTATTRLYYPEDGYRVLTPDLVAVTTLKVDEDGDRTYAQTIASTDYELWPLDGPPYQEVRIWPLSNDTLVPGRYVQIVGSFGALVDGAAPVAVRQATLLLASRYYKRGEAPFGVLSAVDLGQYARIAKEDPDVATLLQPWSLTGSSWTMV